MRELPPIESGVVEPRIALPVPVQPRPPHPFPVIATIAPVAVSGAIWVVTQSPFALIFAALGPAVAIASLADARLQSRKTLRTERTRFARELELTRREVAARHDRERHDLDLASPAAMARLARGDHDPDRWGSSTGAVGVTLGRARVPSSLDLGITPSHSDEQRALQELATDARVLLDAPVSVSAALGIAVVGPPVLAGSIIRGFALQLAIQLSPASHEMVVDELRPDNWLADLPHARTLGAHLAPAELRFRHCESGAEVVLAVAASVERVPVSVRVVIDVAASSGASIIRHPDRSQLGPLEPEFVSREQAALAAARLSTIAKRTAVVSAQEALPTEVLLSHLDLDRAGPGRSSLASPIGIGATGAITVDLVRDGPHAIIGGTTGSGKSELLIAWVLALATRHSPEQITFLLVDFKGGASFAPLAGLPHVVGVMSDLDETASMRALSSLEAEVRYREHIIAEAGARSIDELAASVSLPRLVIVVDEFASLVAGFPDLHTLFSDLAARGRSLGMHLVLCTQRPAGVVRDAVLANSGLRISLRVNNRQDSQAVIGTDAAATLPAKAIGRAFIAIAGEQPTEVQVPLASSGDAAAATAAWPGFAPRAPWRDPLPTFIAAASLEPTTGIAFGRADLPEEQAQPVAAWLPESHGHLLAVGAARSGKSTLLHTIAAASADRSLLAADDAEAVWDAVTDMLAQVRRGAADRILLIDDLDAVLARLSDDHAAALVDVLTMVLREGPGAGVHVAIATQRITPAMSPLASLCDSRLLLRMSSRQDHVIAGGAGDQFVARASAGWAIWQGGVVQIAVDDTDVEMVAAHPLAELDLGAGLAAVSSAPRVLAESLAQRGARVVELTAAGDPKQLMISGGGKPSVVVGDAETWQSHWGAIASLAASVPVLFDGCSLADYRSLTKSRELPPPTVISRAALLLSPDGSVSRIRPGR